MLSETFSRSVEMTETRRAFPLLSPAPMKTRTLLSLHFVLLIGSLVGDLNAQEVKPKAKRPPNPAYAKVEDVPGLPRVLLIGDSISIGYTVAVQELLKGKANVHRIPTNGGPTSNGVVHVKEWLGDSKWDVIHFNFGLHDLVYMGPDGARLVEPSLPGAKHQVPLPDYEKNLSAMVQQLQATGAKVIWCNTTPVPEGTKGRVADESILFNQAAAKVMQAANIPINDLHSHAKAKLAEVQLPANVHFTPEGSKYLAEQVAAEIQKLLK
jgi:GDSL-like Lipase/Acylhydrolase family